MDTASSNYEYSYQNSDSGHHHAYLSSPILALLDKYSLSINCKHTEVRVLDLGCGNGSLSNVIAQQGYKVLGIEESSQGVMLAQQNFPNCKFIQASIYELPYTELESSFDIVISAEVIEHLTYPRELVRVAKKCLKNNGCLILTTPYHGYLKNLTLAISGNMDKHFTALWDGGHIKFFSVATLTQLLQTEGYQNIHFKFAGRLPFLWKSMLCSSSLKAV